MEQDFTIFLLQLSIGCHVASFPFFHVQLDLTPVCLSLFTNTLSLVKAVNKDDAMVWYHIAISGQKVHGVIDTVIADIQKI